MTAIDRIGQVGIVPVITLDDAAHALPLADALTAGGLDVVEITLRTPAGLDAIRRLADHDGDHLVGAGSVRTPAEAEAALAAGAGFLVSPGLDDDIVAIARDHDTCALPGIATATELMRAASLGLEVVKLFPAEAAGGVANLSALASVFPEMGFMPTGGITPDNAPAYLDHPAVVAVGGSWMAPTRSVRDGDWAGIRAAASAAAALAGDRR